MAKHTETGAKGEQVGINYLEKKGYAILNRNWRHGRREVDCIALKDKTVVFVEIKTRSSFDFGFPEEAVDSYKEQFLKEAAEEWMEEHPEYTELQFDIISVLMNKGKVVEIKHIQDAFY
jgi:putative endonuclease